MNASFYRKSIFVPYQQGETCDPGKHLYRGCMVERLGFSYNTLEIAITAVPKATVHHFENTKEKHCTVDDMKLSALEQLSLEN